MTTVVESGHDDLLEWEKYQAIMPIGSDLSRWFPSSFPSVGSWEEWLACVGMKIHI